MAVGATRRRRPAASGAGRSKQNQPFYRINGRGCSPPIAVFSLVEPDTTRRARFDWSAPASRSGVLADRAHTGHSDDSYSPDEWASVVVRRVSPTSLSIAVV